MNEFQLYEQLCILENITEQYRYGRKIKDRIRELANSISTRIYRVAVIGEFKRGKSSLINALIGSKILPTDILPMTASVTRVRYGENKKITVHYKSGEYEEKTIEELINYATKFDAEKENISKDIREVEVNFPSVLCKNNIEFLDTPGMNDDEKMSEITLGVLGDIDAAIMVISAESPLSITEQDLIIKMIGKHGIRHIVFVVTRIDAISDEVSEQNRILDTIKNRISTNLLSRAENTFQDDEYLTEKSRRILAHPDLFGVSSVWAMEGFVADNTKKLKQSRLPEFKQELLDLLTAAQSIDAKEKVAEAINDVGSCIEAWFETEHKELNLKKQNLYKLQKDYEEYFEQSQNMLVALISEADRNLQNFGIFERDSTYMVDFSRKIRRVFIENLSQIKESSNTDDYILDVLKSSFAFVSKMIEDFNNTAEAELDKAIHHLYVNYSKLRPCYSENRTECIFPLSLALKVYLKKRETAFPKMCINNDILNSDNFVGVNLIDIIEKKIKSATDVYGESIENYIATWRVLFLRHNIVSLKNNSILKIIADEISEVELRMNYMKVNINSDLMKIQALQGLLNGEN